MWTQPLETPELFRMFTSWSHPPGSSETVVALPAVLLIIWLMRLEGARRQAPEAEGVG